MKCWHKHCNKKLKMGFTKSGYCVEHGFVWGEDKFSEIIKLQNKKMKLKRISNNQIIKAIADYRDILRLNGHKPRRDCKYCKSVLAKLKPIAEREYETS